MDTKIDIVFNRPPCAPKAGEYMGEAVRSGKISGDGGFTRKCNEWLENATGARQALLTTSCTHALEMAALLCDIQPGDEVIMPSYTFVSSANAFALRGAAIRFIDIRPDTMNMDEGLLEAAITPKTRAVVPVHYAGVACEMDTINAIAKAHGLRVVEDAAQGVQATYKGRPLGTLGDLGCFSFHETKNLSMGEGGALLIARDDALAQRAEILREKGTDRSRFFRGQVDKYTWVDIGSSYLPSDLNAAYLYAQLEIAEAILQDRLHSWNAYHEGLAALAQKGLLERPFIPKECVHNAHMYYIKVKDVAERSALIEHLGRAGILAVFHYVPLHSAKAGRAFGSFVGEDVYTTKESERLLRLPLYYGLGEEDRTRVLESIHAFFGGKG